MEPSSLDPLFLLDTLRNPEAMVARVGELTISAREFFLSYQFGPAFPKRGPDSRRRYLRLMINEKLLALGARDRGLARDPRVTSALAQLTGDFATEELYRDDVLSGIRVTEGEVDRAVEEDRETASVRWLFFEEADDAAGASEAFRRGADFDSAYGRHLREGRIQEEDRKTTTTLFQLGRRNAALSSVIATVPRGAVSAPVRGPDGWYVVRLDSSWTRVITTESEFARLRVSMRRAVKQAKADSLSSGYISAMMRDADPVIQRRTFDILRAWVGSRRLSPERFDAFGLDDRFERAEDSVDFRNIQEHSQLSLVVTRNGDISLAEFLAWYEPREALVSYRWSSPQVFFLSLEDVVWRMVRDHLLIQRAAARGMQDRAAVAEQIEWWRHKLLFQAEKDVAARGIRWADSTLMAHYAKNRARFRGPAGRSFEEARDDVLRDWYDSRMRESLRQRLTSLRRKYPVVEDAAVLASVPVDASNEPRTIDLYAVKKGGTFPRPAFPSIDATWQTWE
jgi:hypothetical protein